MQARTASIEVDILKCNSMRESEGNIRLSSSQFDKNQFTSRNLEEAVDADSETTCIGDQRGSNGHQADKESIKTNVEILLNQLPPQEAKMEDDAVPSPDTEGEEIVANIEKKLQTSLCLVQQNCKDENISGLKSVGHTEQRNCDLLVSQSQRNETHFTAASIYEASKCHDVKGNELKTDHKPPSHLASSAENSSHANANLNKLQVDLGGFDSRNSHKEAANVLNKASERGDCTLSSNKEETVDCKLAKSCEDEGNSSSSHSEEDSCIDSSKSDKGSDGLEFDKHETSESASEQDHFLPSVEQFEEDFEEYLENVSNVLDNYIEKIPHTREFSADGGIYSEYKLHSDFKDDSYNETPTDGYLASQQFSSFPDTCHQMSHQDSYSTGYQIEQSVQAQIQTDLRYSGYHDNIYSEGGWNSLNPCTGFYCQCDWFSTHNYYHDQSYNTYSSFLGNHAANWQVNAQRHPDSASSQQCLGDFYGDISSYQDHQWNTSWYNAYQRQTGCIRQFVSFSRSARFNFL